MNPFQTTKSQRPTVNDIWPSVSRTGIFRQLKSLDTDGTRFPWLTTTDDASALNLLYYLNHSGKKLASNLLLYFVADDGILDSESLPTISNTVAFKYERNWRKLWNTLIIEYNPASNYKVITERELSREDSEDESLNSVKNATESVNYGKTQTTSHGLKEETTYGRQDATTHGLKEETTYGKQEATAHGHQEQTAHGLTTTDDTSRYAFNSASAVPTDKVQSANTGTDTVTNSGTDTVTDSGKDTVQKSGTDSVQSSGKDTVQNSGSDTVSDTGNDSKTNDATDDSTRIKSGESAETERVVKEGAIGTVSIQQLISEEHNLWIWNFFDQVFKDIDSELTLQIYDVCR